MKKLVLFSVALCCCFSALAQWMPDSTVQVVAYWDKGDKAVYQVHGSVKQVFGDGTEKLISEDFEKHSLEVIDQTDSAYVVRMKICDTQLSSVTDPLESELRNELQEEMTFDFLTTELGRPLEFMNLFDESERLQKRLQQVTDSFFARHRRLKKDEKQRLEAAAEGIRAFTASLESFKKLGEDAFLPLLYWHGSRLDTTQIYTIDSSVENLFGTTVPAKRDIWVDAESSDSSVVVIRGYTKLEHNELMPLLEKFMLDNIRSSTADDSEYDEAVNEWFDSVSEKHLALSLERYDIWAVHLGTGWTVVYSQEQHLAIKDDESDVDTISSIDIKYILDN